MNLSIQKKIWAGFSALVIVFLINGVLTIVTENNIQNISRQISTSVEPTEELLEDFKAEVIESKMYATNWVFLRYNDDDKKALKYLHNQKYPKLKSQLKALFPIVENDTIINSLNTAFMEFEALIIIEQNVMAQLAQFEDYDDPIKKMLAEQEIEDQVIPRTNMILNMLDRANSIADNIKREHYLNREKHTEELRFYILLLTASAIGLGIILSVYFSRIITMPIDKMQVIISNLGKGIINKVDHKKTNDEIGKMIESVNNLASKLQDTALFAEAIGHRDYTTAFHPLSDEDKLGKALVAMRDNIKSGEESLMAANSELKKSNSELDKFVYSVSHDLRAPLSSMLGIISLIEAENTDENIAGDVQLVKRNIKKLDGFISDILDYSRNARMEIVAHDIDFELAIKDVTGNLKYMASMDGSMKIETNVEKNVPFYSDVTRVNVILNNLVSNAIRYSKPDGGSPLVSINITVNESEAIIIIKDNGIGISHENLDKVFVMFYRISKKSVGSGLGLYIVKETVEKLKGNIYLESELNEGTTFTVKLPNLSKEFLSPQNELYV